MQPGEPPYLLQIVDGTGKVVRTNAGGPHEAKLIDLFVTHIVGRGVGLFRSQAHVEADIRAGIEAAIRSLKIENPFDVI